MADFRARIVPGTPLVWRSSSGDAVLDHGGTFADGQAYMGAALDLSSGSTPFTFEDEYSVYAKVDTGSVAPTAGALAEFFYVSNWQNSDWPGGVSGSSGQYKSGEEEEWLDGLNSLGALTFTNDANTNVLQLINPIWRAPSRFIVPVVYNLSGQTLGAAADFRLILVPRIPLLEEQ